MRQLVCTLGMTIALVGCDDIAMTPGGATTGASTGGGFSGAPQEYLVLGSNMGFEDCRARGGLIIRDQGSPMVACDPRVRGTPVPANEFDHPGSPVPQVTAEPAAADG